VNSPINPEWTAKYDADGARATDLDERIRLALEGTGARYWNGAAAFKPGIPAFYDSVHLRSPVARQFTQLMLDEALPPAT
jgi:hypothetical protein